jgi:hypothetical protein
MRRHIQSSSRLYMRELVLTSNNGLSVFQILAAPSLGGAINRARLDQQPWFLETAL